MLERLDVTSGDPDHRIAAVVGALYYLFLLYFLSFHYHFQSRAGLRARLLIPLENVTYIKTVILGAMLPNVRSVAGKAHQQPHENQRQRDIHFQGLGNNGLGNGPIMSYEGLNEVLYSPAAVHKVDREMVDWDVFFNR